LCQRASKATTYRLRGLEDPTHGRCPDADIHVLTGIPPTAGFMGKFYIFMSAINAGYTWLVIIAVIFSAISAYFYLRIVMNMYMKEPKETVQLSTSPGLGLALLITVVAVLLIGVLPSAVVNFARIAVAGF
jgi:NADH-quinone oxidoreductase subunit N